jgi:tetratricopeptide (TPR) repeat protein
MTDPTPAQIKLAEDNDKNLGKAESCYDRGDYPGAIHAYGRLIQLDPEDTWSYWERSLMKKAKGELNGALKDLDKAITLDSQNSYAYYQRAIVKEKQKNKKGAEADFAMAQNLRGTSPLPPRESKQNSKANDSPEKDGRSYS